MHNFIKSLPSTSRCKIMRWQTQSSWCQWEPLTVLGDSECTQLFPRYSNNIINVIGD